MIEVFKTNVETEAEAKAVLIHLQNTFENLQANFDLEDVDKILRVKCETCIHTPDLISRLEELGFRAEVLPDIIPSVDNFFSTKTDIEAEGTVFGSLIVRLMLTKFKSLST